MLSLTRAATLALAVGAAIPATAVAQVRRDAALASRITQLADSSKKVFSALSGGSSGPVMVSREAMRGLMAMEQLVSTEVRTVIDSIGWPGRAIVGDTASSAFAKLILQVRDLPLQERAAAAMEKAVATGEASSLDYAVLIDRVRVNGGRQQLYGTALTVTQFGVAIVAPIADSASVDARRKAVGLGSLADSVAAIKQPTAPPGVQIIKPPVL